MAVKLTRVSEIGDVVYIEAANGNVVGSTEIYSVHLRAVSKHVDRDTLKAIMRQMVVDTFLAKEEARIPDWEDEDAN